MNNKRAKLMRQLVKQSFGYLFAEYDKINTHLKAYGIDFVTGQPNLHQVSQVVLSDSCGRKRYKELKKANTIK